MTDVAIRVDNLGRMYRSGPSGCPQYVSVNELVETVARVAGKTIHVEHVDGPVGVQSRNFSNARMESIGWRARVFLEEGIARTYPWIEEQVRGGQMSPRGRAADDRESDPCPR